MQPKFPFLPFDIRTLFENDDHMPTRIALLLAFMLVVAIIDRWRNGSQATRFKEYGFILFAGLIGALLGGANDFITSTISPDYFICGKGLEPGDGFKTKAVLFGLGEGFSAGIMAGAVCLFAARYKSKNPPAPYQYLFRNLWLPVAGSILVGAILPAIASSFDPLNFSSDLKDLMPPEKIQAFRTVWWAHTGLYAGTLIGLICLIIKILKHRKSQKSACDAA